MRRDALLDEHLENLRGAIDLPSWRHIVMGPRINHVARSHIKGAREEEAVIGMKSSRNLLKETLSHL